MFETTKQYNFISHLQMELHSTDLHCQLHDDSLQVAV